MTRNEARETRFLTSLQEAHTAMEQAYRDFYRARPTHRQTMETQLKTAQESLFAAQRRLEKLYEVLSDLRARRRHLEVHVEGAEKELSVRRQMLARHEKHLNGYHQEEREHLIRWVGQASQLLTQQQQVLSWHDQYTESICQEIRRRGGNPANMTIYQEKQLGLEE